MSKLYNVQTGLEESLPIDQIPAAISAGTHAYKKGTTLNVVDQNNESYSVDASELPTVFEEGYRLESPDETAVREYVKENEGIVGAAKVLGREAIDQMSLGVSEAILKNTSDPLEVAKYEALKKDQELASAAGNIAGFGASFFTGAPVFKAGEKIGKAVAGKIFQTTGKEVGEKAAEGIAKSAAQKATEMGVEGAAIAAPVAITEAALGDPEAAAESLMMGGILGGALGGTVGALKPLAKMGKDKIAYMTNQKKLETDAAYNLIGATPVARTKVPRDVDERLPQFLKEISDGDRSLLSNPEKLAKRIEDVEMASGKKLDEIVNTLDDRINQTAKESPEAAQELKSSMYNYNDLITKLEDKYVKPYLDDPRYNAQVQKVQLELENIKNKIASNFGGDAQPINLKALRKLQQDSKNLINYDKVNNVADLATDARKEIVSDIQQYFKSGIESKIKDVFPDLANTASQFKAANDAYRMAVTISPIVDKAAAKMDTKQAVTFGDMVLGGLGYGAGDITGAIGAIAARRGINYLNRNFDVGGLLFAEQIMKKTATALDEIPKKLKSISKPIRARLSNNVSDITGNKEDNNFDKLTEKITAVGNNPARLEEFFANSVDVIGDQGAPQIADSTRIKTADTLNYLANLVPKPLVPANPLVKSRGYKPSEAEKNKFMRQVKAALEPMSIVDDLANGTVTKDQLQVVADIYPDLYERIKQKVIDSVTENPEEVPYNKRLKLSLLLNVDLDPSLSPELLPSLINIQAPESEQPKSPSNSANFTSYPTATERIAMK